MFHPQKILIIRQDALGDLITAFPLIGLVDQLFPDAELHVLAREPFLPLVDCLTGVNKTIAYPEIESRRLRKGGLNRRAAKKSAATAFKNLRQILAAEKYDLAICLFPQPAMARLLWNVRIPNRLGSGRRWYSIFFNHRRYHSKSASHHHESWYAADLLHALPLSSGQTSELASLLAGFPAPLPSLVLPPLTRSDLTEFMRSPYMVIHPFKTASSLKWPEAYFRELLERIADGRTPGPARVAVTGTAPERAGLERLCQGLPPEKIRIWTDLNLTDLSSLISRAAVWVGNSTGPMHIASFLGTPVVGLFGRAPAFTARRWGPIYHPETGTGLEADVPQCPRCIYELCPYFNCLEKVSVGRVVAEVGRLTAPARP